LIDTYYLVLHEETGIINQSQIGLRLLCCTVSFVLWVIIIMKEFLAFHSNLHVIIMQMMKYVIPVYTDTHMHL